MKRNSYTDAVRQIAESKGTQILGNYGCLGYYTFGPFKLVGRIANGRPNEADIAEAITFF